MKNKNLPIVLGLIIIVLLSVLIILNFDLWNKSQYENYVDEKAGYSITYRTFPDGYIAMPITENLPENIDSSVVFANKQLWEDFSESEGAHDGPMIISIQSYTKTTPNMTALDWVKTSRNSGYVLGVTTGSSPELNTIQTKNGDAVSYVFPGLYNNDAIVISYGEKILMFTASWDRPNDKIRKDMSDMFESLEVNM